MVTCVFIAYCNFLRLLLFTLGGRSKRTSVQLPVVFENHTLSAELVYQYCVASHPYTSVALLCCYFYWGCSIVFHCNSGMGQASFVY